MGIPIASLVVLAIPVVSSMFGRGGGSLYNPVLVLLGWDLKTAISSALVLNLATALVATLVFARSRLVDPRSSTLFLPGTMVGALWGALLNNSAPKNLRTGIPPAFLPGADFLMIRAGKGQRAEPPRPMTRRLLIPIVVFCFAVGVLSSLIGVGGGLVIFPSLVLYLKYLARKPAGSNPHVVAASSLAGFLGHRSAGHVYPVSGPADWRQGTVTASASARKPGRERPWAGVEYSCG